MSANWQVKIGKRGRITTPKQVRQEMNLKHGDRLALRLEKLRKTNYIYLGRHLDEIFNELGADDFRRRSGNG